MNKYLKITAYLLLSTLVLLTQGCAEKREDRIKKILAHDPSFKSYLDKRDSLQKKMDSQKKAFIQDKMGIENQINVLREKQIGLKEEYTVSIGETKRQIQPEKRRMGQDMMEMKRDLALKKIELNGTLRDINEINSLIKKKDKLALTREEMQTWNDRLSSLVEKKATIMSEISKLEKEIEMTREKIKVLDLD
jgi:chromosome segregation ATPase